MKNDSNTINDKFLFSLARVVYPAAITISVEIGRNRILKNIERIEIIHSSEKNKYLFAWYAVKVFYKDCYRKVRSKAERQTKTEAVETDEKLKTRTSPELKIVRRDVVKQQLYDVIFGMKDFFHANVLLVQDLKTSESLKEMKEAFKLNDLALVFEKEINGGGKDFQ